MLHIATGWAAVSPEYEAAIDVPDPDERACHIETAVRLLLGQPPGTARNSVPIAGREPVDGVESAVDFRAGGTQVV